MKLSAIRTLILDAVKTAVGNDYAVLNDPKSADDFLAHAKGSFSVAFKDLTSVIDYNNSVRPRRSDVCVFNVIFVSRDVVTDSGALDAIEDVIAEIEKINVTTDQTPNPMRTQSVSLQELNKSGVFAHVIPFEIVRYRQ